MHASARPAGTGPVRLNPSTEPVCSTTPPQPHCQHQPGWTQVARAVAPYDIGPVRATPSSPPMSERVIRFSHCRCGFSAFKLRVAISSEPSYTARWRKLKEKSRLAAPRIRRKTKTIVPSCCGDISASQPRKRSQPWSKLAVALLERSIALARRAWVAGKPGHRALQFRRILRSRRCISLLHWFDAVLASTLTQGGSFLYKVL